MKIKKIIDQPLFLLAAETIAIAAILSSLFLLGEWYASSSFGYGGFFVIMIVTWFNLPIAAAFFGIPASIIFMFIKKLKGYAFKLFLCSIVYILVAFPIARMANSIRSSAFSRLATQPSPLVNAIHQFVQENKTPPKVLDDLIPKYIKKIPSTGMPAYPYYVYISGKKAEKWNGNPWVLYIFTPRGFANFDMFIYFPLQNYPEKGWGGTIEKMGEWGYVHE